ncbi:papilin-like [Anthonomus grandis grandis]|uniref:papilin-like n=1 Tax=Anthonomus grandis grandis TaxID=2921223 RepID=UPI0021653BC6|nr:papilin-like [Anthonomus grandis grandis]
MRAKLEFEFSVLLLLIPTTFTAQCRTCSNDQCHQDSIELTTCTPFSAVTPFQTSGLIKDDPNQEYVCLKIEYFNGGTTELLQQCFIAQNIYTACESLAKEVSYTYCDVERPQQEQDDELLEHAVGTLESATDEAVESATSPLGDRGLRPSSDEESTETSIVQSNYVQTIETVEVSSESDASASESVAFSSSEPVEVGFTEGLTNWGLSNDIDSTEEHITSTEPDLSNNELSSEVTTGEEGTSFTDGVSTWEPPKGTDASEDHITSTMRTESRSSSDEPRSEVTTIPTEAEEVTEGLTTWKPSNDIDSTGEHITSNEPDSSNNELSSKVTTGEEETSFTESAKAWELYHITSTMRTESTSSSDESKSDVTTSTIDEETTWGSSNDTASGGPLLANVTHLETTEIPQNFFDGDVTLISTNVPSDELHSDTPSDEDERPSNFNSGDTNGLVVVLGVSVGLVVVLGVFVELVVVVGVSVRLVVVVGVSVRLVVVVGVSVELVVVLGVSVGLVVVLGVSVGLVVVLGVSDSWLYSECP